MRNAARLADGKPILFVNEQHDVTLLGWLQSFFSITSFKARFSRLKSAYIIRPWQSSPFRQTSGL